MSYIKATHNSVERRTLTTKDGLRECGWDDANWILMPETGSTGQLIYCQINIQVVKITTVASLMC